MSLSKIFVNNTEVVAVDNEPIHGSKNLINSTGVAKQIQNSPQGDFTIDDENRNTIVLFSDGHIQTKEFNSSECQNKLTQVETKLNTIEEGAQVNEVEVENSEQNADFTIDDENRNNIVIFSEGHIRTKNFDSTTLTIEESIIDIFDFSLDDADKNSIIRFFNGHIRTKNFNSETVINDIEELKQQSRISGKHFGSFSVLGDSYSTFRGYTTPANANHWYPDSSQHIEGHNDVIEPTQQWWYLFANEYKSLLKDNISWSGAPISYDGWGTGTSDGKAISFITRAATYLTAETKPELLFVFGGTNDAWIGVNMGENQYSDWTDEDLCSFRPALCKLMHDLTTKKEYIGMQVIMIWNNGLNQNYTNAARDICPRYNVPLLELSSVTKKGNHPDAAGMVTIKNQLINFLKNI